MIYATHGLSYAQSSAQIRANGDVISRTHQAFKDGSIIHQHQNHIGKYGTVRTFPEEWLMFPTIK